jgi:hypothetical protein
MKLKCQSGVVQIANALIEADYYPKVAIAIARVDLIWQGCALLDSRRFKQS